MMGLTTRVPTLEIPRTRRRGLNHEWARRTRIERGALIAEEVLPDGDFRPWLSHEKMSSTAITMINMHVVSSVVRVCVGLPRYSHSAQSSGTLWRCLRYKV